MAKKKAVKSSAPPDRLFDPGETQEKLTEFAALLERAAGVLDVHGITPDLQREVGAYLSPGPGSSGSPMARLYTDLVRTEEQPDRRDAIHHALKILGKVAGADGKKTWKPDAMEADKTTLKKLAAVLTEIVSGKPAAVERAEKAAALVSLLESVQDFASRVRQLPIAGEDGETTKRRATYGINRKFQVLENKAIACFERIRPFQNACDPCTRQILPVSAEEWDAIETVEDTIRRLMLDTYGVRFNFGTHAKTGAESIIVAPRDSEGHNSRLNGGMRSGMEQARLTIPSLDPEWLTTLDMAIAGLKAEAERLTGNPAKNAENAAAVVAQSPQILPKGERSQDNVVNPGKKRIHKGGRTATWTDLVEMIRTNDASDSPLDRKALAAQYNRRYSKREKAKPETISQLRTRYLSGTS